MRKFKNGTCGLVEVYMYFNNCRLRRRTDVVFVILGLFFFDVLSLVHPLTTMLFFMQDFENPPVGPAAGWSYVAVHNTNPVSLCKMGKERGRNGSAPHSTIHEVIGISIPHSAARDFHQDGLGTIRILVEPSSYSPANTGLIVHSGRASSSLSVLSLVEVQLLARQNHPIYFASHFSLSAPRIEPSDTQFIDVCS